MGTRNEEMRNENRNDFTKDEKKRSQYQNTICSEAEEREECMRSDSTPSLLYTPLMTVT